MLLRRDPALAVAVAALATAVLQVAFVLVEGATTRDGEALVATAVGQLLTPTLIAASCALLFPEGCRRAQVLLPIVAVLAGIAALAFLTPLMLDDVVLPAPLLRALQLTVLAAAGALLATTSWILISVLPIRRRLLRVTTGVAAGVVASVLVGGAVEQTTPAWLAALTLTIVLGARRRQARIGSNQ